MSARRCFIGLGTSLGDRRMNLEKAARALKGISDGGHLKLSPIYETPAMVPKGAPAEWRTPYLNAAAEIHWSASPTELLGKLKTLEVELGREPAPRWAPRTIDLDLLLFGDEQLASPGLNIPHAGLWDRSFVVDPLKDLAPNLTPPGMSETLLQRSRQLAGRAPLWMAILNVTPDSFSDGGQLERRDDLARRLDECEAMGVQILDLGGESTRPGAASVTVDEEWSRVRPVLEAVRERWEGRMFRPLVSVDTRRAETARRALENGADWINDVSGLADPAMQDLAKERDVTCIIMHSLTVPADPKVLLPPERDPVVELKAWAEKRIEDLLARGLSLDRLVIDPGIGFGKSAEQSFQILSQLEKFSRLPVRLLIGHSRKSFLKLFTEAPADMRDGESVGLSLGLAQKGADIIRVHNPRLHVGAFRAWYRLSHDHSDAD